MTLIESAASIVLPREFYYDYNTYPQPQFILKEESNNDSQFISLGIWFRSQITRRCSALETSLTTSDQYILLYSFLVQNSLSEYLSRNEYLVRLISNTIRNIEAVCSPQRAGHGRDSSVNLYYPKIEYSVFLHYYCHMIESLSPQVFTRGCFE